MLNIQLVSFSLVGRNYSNYKFKQIISDQISSWDEEAVGVLPEYCWPANILREDIDSITNFLIDQLSSKQQLVIGSLPLKINGKLHNSAVYINGSGGKSFIPKYHVLSEEHKRSKVVSGENPGYIEFNNLRIQIVICADMWDSTFLSKLLHPSKKIDLLVVPAFTTVPKNHRNYARMQWYSLSVVRSREYIIPVMVADHRENTPKYDVGNASCIVDPSKKSSSMESLKDFLILSDTNTIKYMINLDNVKKYRQYRLDKGIYGLN